VFMPSDPVTGSHTVSLESKFQRNNTHRVTIVDLSPSFNWKAAGLNDQDMKEYIWKLGKLGFM
jgi:isocitrate lyase